MVYSTCDLTAAVSGMGGACILSARIKTLPPFAVLITVTVTTAASYFIFLHYCINKMHPTAKRACTSPLNDSLEKRIKRISIEGNIGKYYLFSASIF